MADNINRNENGTVPTTVETAPLFLNGHDTQGAALEVKASPELETCELIESQVEPSLENFSKLNIVGNAAYVWYQNKLYYLNRKKQQSLELQMGERARLRLLFDFQLNRPFKAHKYQSRFLNLTEQNTISLLTGHIHASQVQAPHNASDWWVKNGCDLLVVNEKPTLEKLRQLQISNAAYVRYKDELYYYKKKTSWKWFERIFSEEAIKLNVPLDLLERFDALLKASTSQHRKLTELEVEQIELLIHHMHMTRFQKFLSRLGKILSALISVSCAAMTAGMFLKSGLAMGALLFGGAGVIFVAGVLVNWWLFEKYVSPVMIDLFGKEKFLVDEDGKPLKVSKKFWMGLALVLSVAGGITYAACVFDGALTLLAAAGLASAACPPLAMFAAGVTFICITALMIKDIAKLIKRRDVIGDIKTFCKNMVSTDPNLEVNKGKSPFRIKAQIFAKFVLMALALPGMAFGLYMTANASAPIIQAFLMDKIPLAACVIVTGGAVFLSFLGNIPFAAKIMIDYIGAIFDPAPKVDPERVVSVKPASMWGKAWKGFKFSQVIFNGFGNGLLPLAGAVASGFYAAATAFTSGFFGSVCTGAAGVMDSKPAPLKINLPKRAFDEYDTTTVIVSDPRLIKPNVSVAQNSNSMFKQTDEVKQINTSKKVLKTTKLKAGSDPLSGLSLMAKPKVKKRVIEKRKVSDYAPDDAHVNYGHRAILVR